MSPRTRNRKLWLCCVSLLLCLAQGAAAEPKQESAAQLAMKKAQGALRQLGEEKRALETEKAALQEQLAQLDGIAKQVPPLQSELQQHKAGADSLRQANQALEAQLHGEQERSQSLQRKLREIAAAAKQIQGDNALLLAAVQERQQWIAQCSDKNRQLLEANQELLRQYQDKGLWSSLAEQEPFTGIATVATQNTVETYRYKLEDLQASGTFSAIEDQTQAIRHSSSGEPP